MSERKPRVRRQRVSRVTRPHAKVFEPVSLMGQVSREGSTILQSAKGNDYISFLLFVQCRKEQDTGESQPSLWGVRCIGMIDSMRVATAPYPRQLVRVLGRPLLTPKGMTLFVSHVKIVATLRQHEELNEEESCPESVKLS